MAKKTNSPRAEALSDEELEGVTGAGDPVPYPDVDSGGSETKVEATGSATGSTSSASGSEAGTSKGLVSGKTTGGSTSTSPSGTVVHAEGKSVIRNL